MSVSISFTFSPGSHGFMDYTDDSCMREAVAQRIVYNGHAGLGANQFDACKNEVSIESLASACLPEVNDEVLVAFGHGDPRQPYLIGSLWSSADEPAQTSR